MHKLKLFMIEQLNAATFQWGWISPSQDIIGADMVGVKIRGKTISWPEVNGAQLLRIIDHCLKSKTAPYKAKAENALGAAILCQELGGTDQARKYVNQALEFSVTVKDEITRLLPLPE